MPIETGMYNQPAAKPINPLETLQQATGIQNALVENKLLQQEQSGKEALAHSYVSNPDGSINYPATRQKLQQSGAAYRMHDLNAEALAANEPREYFDPRTKQQMRVPAQNIGGVMNPAGNQVPGNNLLQRPQPQQPPQPQLPPKSVDDVNKTHDHFSSVQEALGKLADNPNLSEKDIIRTTSSLIADGRMKPMDAIKAWQGIPHGPNGEPATREQLQQYVQQSMQQLGKAQQTFTSVYGPPGNSAAPQQQPAATPPPAQTQYGDQQPPAPTQDQPPMGVPAGPPMGFAENQAARQKHYLDVQNARNSVPQENAALNNILNISKQDLPSGTLVGKVYEALASTGLAPKGITETGAQLQIIKSHAAQLNTSDMPGSDKRLDALESAKVGDKNLPQVIQAMVPYLIAVNNSKLEQAKFYGKFAGDGTDPDKVAKAQSIWTENVDPRLFEMKELMKDRPQLDKYVKGLSKQDKQNLLEKYNAAKAHGIIQ